MSFGTPLNPQGFGTGTAATSNWTSDSYVVPAGNNKRLVCVVGAHAANTTSTTFSAATFDGAAMTPRVAQMQGQWIFGIFDLALGSATPTGTFNFQISSSRRFVMVVFVLEDADQSEAPMVSSVVSALSHSLAAVPAGWLSISGLVDLGGTGSEPAPGTGQTLIGSKFGSSSDRWAVASYRGVAGGTQSFDYTNATSSAPSTGLAILAFKPAGGGGDTIAAGRATAAAAAQGVQVSADTAIFAERAAATAQATGASVIGATDIVIGNAEAAASSHVSGVVSSTLLKLGAATGLAQTYAASFIAGVSVVTGKAAASVQAAAAVVIRARSLVLGFADALAFSRRATVSAGGAPVAPGRRLLRGLGLALGLSRM